MISSLSSLSGLSAATDRLEALAGNVASKDTGGGLPKAGAPIAQEAYQPIRVEQAAQSDVGATYNSLRSTTPAYLAVYDPQDANADQNGLVAKPNVDFVQEPARAEEEEASFDAKAKTLEAQNEVVKKLYDLP